MDVRLIDDGEIELGKVLPARYGLDRGDLDRSAVVGSLVRALHDPDIEPLIVEGVEGLLYELDAVADEDAALALLGCLRE